MAAHMMNMTAKQMADRANAWLDIAEKEWEINPETARRASELALKWAVLAKTMDDIEERRDGSKRGGARY